MAFILKSGKIYQDPYEGEIDSAYAIIGELNNDLIAHEANISVLVYRSKQARENGKPPVERKGFFVTLEDYDKFFLKSMLQMEGVTIESQAYAYLSRITYIASRYLDEHGDEVVVRELVWGDWESDEE